MTLHNFMVVNELIFSRPQGLQVAQSKRVPMDFMRPYIIIFSIKLCTPEFHVTLRNYIHKWALSLFFYFLPEESLLWVEFIHTYLIKR